MKHFKDYIGILSLFFLSVCLRLYLSLASPLPYNVDGFPLIRIAQNMLDTGQWTIESGSASGNIEYNAMMPIFSLLLAQLSLLSGINVAGGANILVPLLSSTSVVAVYAVVYKITDNRIAAMAAGFFFACNGFSVYLGAAVMKQAVGMALMPFILYLFYGRKDARKRALAMMLLLLLPLTHHLSTIITFSMLCIMAAASNAGDYRDGKLNFWHLILDVISIPAAFAFVLFYYIEIGLIDLDMAKVYSPLDVNSMALHLAVLFIFSLVAVATTISRKVKTRSPLFSVIVMFPAIGIGVLFFNMETRIFAGAINTSPDLLKLMIPYLLLLIAACVGLDLVAFRKNSHRPIILAAVFGPFVTILYALFKGLDIPSFNLLYRSYNFADFGFAICAGIGVGYMVSWAKRTEIVTHYGRDGQENPIMRRTTLRKLAAPAIVAFMVISVSTLPLGYSQEEFTGFRSQTLPSEFRGMTYVAESGIGNDLVCTDQWFADILSPYYDVKASWPLPILLRNNRDTSECSYMFLEQSWTTRGGQIYPFDPIVVPDENVRNAILSNNLLYSIKTPTDRMYFIQIGK